MKPNIPLSTPPAVLVYDTTLRDGTQREGISVSAVDKIQIARLLDGLGVTFLELGWPGSNPKDAEVFDRARDIAWSGATVGAPPHPHASAAMHARCRIEPRRDSAVMLPPSLSTVRVTSYAA